MSGVILGISAYYHDSAAALIIDGEIVAAAQEERFTRKKHDSSFPSHAIEYVLKEAGLGLSDISAIAFYDKPFITFERLLETYHSFAPKGLRNFLSGIPVWIKEKLFMKKMLYDKLSQFGPGKPPLLFSEHHLSHAASAFFPSPFNEAAILTIDGVGEWATTTISHGNGNSITMLRELHFPHSLGLLYSAFTYYCGFKVNSGEYKLMGLAPYGEQNTSQKNEFKQKILDELIDIREDGSILLNMNYFNFATGLTMCHEGKWVQLFGIPRRKPESELTQPYMNLALAIQELIEEIVLRLADTAKKLTGCEYLVMAGGVALNCVANGKILRSGKFKDIFIQPAAGDAGGALGAAYAVWYINYNNDRNSQNIIDSMKGSYWGPEFNSYDIRRVTRKYNAPCKFFEEFSELINTVADFIARGNVIGWFQGRMEYGPRALGNRSIIADPRNPEMQKKLNLKIKHREGFRPFAPTVLEEDIPLYFELDRPSPYMLLVSPIKKELREDLPDNYENLGMFERLYYLRSNIPVVTHVDFSARIQSVNKEINYKYWKLINAFKEKTGYGIVVNTSFNVRGEPIVCTPEDAYLCFMRTEMDFLVINNFLFAKDEQPELFEKMDWKEEFELD